MKLLPAGEEAEDRGSERWSGSAEDARLESDPPSGTRTPSSPAPAPRACARARARSPLLCRDARVPEAAADPPWTVARSAEALGARTEALACQAVWRPGLRHTPTFAPRRRQEAPNVKTRF